MSRSTLTTALLQAGAADEINRTDRVTIAYELSAASDRLEHRGLPNVRLQLYKAAADLTGEAS